MDWRAFLLLSLAVNICYGQNTCKTNPRDNECYCVLDSKSTDNWYEAVSFCQEQKGILVDINSQNTNDFVVSLMADARLTDVSVTDAWVGVKGDSSSATSVSDPSTAISYTPIWNTPLDSPLKMCASITSSGNWDGVECSGSGITKSTICRFPPIDSSGYNIDTGCPFNGYLQGSKCYQTFTWATGETFDNTINFCQAKTPGGKLILPTSDDKFQFIRKVGKLSGLDKFWIRVEYGTQAPHYMEYGTNNYPPYIGNALTTAAVGGSGSEKFVINVVDGTWEKKYSFLASGVMCEFDAGTPGPAESSLCPVPSATAAVPTTDVSTAAVPTTDVSTAAVPTTDVSTAAVPTTDVSTAALPTTDVSNAVVPNGAISAVAPKTTVSWAPNASEKNTSPTGCRTR